MSVRPEHLAFANVGATELKCVSWADSAVAVDASAHAVSTD